ncbi:glycosyltransferase [Fibrella forsythiae]|uniref:Glycosyltransferase family 1 protein n=1 Tax=Fibrella forsythiae TaxID=2817061 RepID=A0ABS3JRE3_9BACT|nr:glycosyltransferase [Fibrella forsythiae]MBO0952581.1 glycosyltransferase family 1 protein [Fibrella forsythiae]
MTPQRILFATMPLDGHFNPLTGLAVHLQQLGHDVRWYVGGPYGDRVRNLGLHHYPIVKAQFVNQTNIDEIFPERTVLKNPIARLRFDIDQFFLRRGPEYVEDIRAIYLEWPFDLIVYDCACVGGLLVQQLLSVKGVSMGIIPLSESDDYVPVSGLGLQPATSALGQIIQGLVRRFVQNVLFKPSNKLYNQLRLQLGLPPEQGFVFDSLIRKADLYLQSGVPGFEFPRQQISPTIRYVGSLLPHRSGKVGSFGLAECTLHYKHVVLVTQGTFECDPEKIIVPTLEVFKNDPDTMVIVTTGSSGTAELRHRYPQTHIIIEDFIDFNVVMPYVSVYVTNGGYGGVMMAIQHKLPIVVAGIHEGKNEIAARIAYCRVGINLKTETPKPVQIQRAVRRVLADPLFKNQVRQLSHEFSQYQPNELAAGHIHALMMSQSNPILAGVSSPVD